MFHSQLTIQSFVIAHVAKHAWQLVKLVLNALKIHVSREIPWTSKCGIANDDILAHLCTFRYLLHELSVLVKFASIEFMNL